jgi:hypothetical protein
MQRKHKQDTEIELEYGQPLARKRLPSRKDELCGMAFDGWFRGVKGHAV